MVLLLSKTICSHTAGRFKTLSTERISVDQKPNWFNNAGVKPQFSRKGARKVGAVLIRGVCDHSKTNTKTIGGACWVCGTSQNVEDQVEELQAQPKRP